MKLSVGFNTWFHYCNNERLNCIKCVEEMWLRWMAFLIRRSRVKFLVVKLIGSSTKLFRNGLKQSTSGGKVSFVAQTGPMAGSIAADSGSPISAAWGDFDGDGDMDCYVGHSVGIGDKLYVNDGGGVFSTSTIFGQSNNGDTFNTVWQTNAVAWADFDGDG